MSVDNPGDNGASPGEYGDILTIPGEKEGEILRFPVDILWKTTVLAVENAEIPCAARSFLDSTGEPCMYVDGV